MAGPVIAGMNPAGMGAIIIAACGGLGVGITGIGLVATGDGNCSGMNIGIGNPAIGPHDRGIIIGIPIIGGIT
jgi:hypothetical protein